MRKIYEIVFNEENDCLISKVSIVDEPAIESNFMAFSKCKMNFAVQDDMKRIITGALMIPDFEIYRNEPGLEDCYVKFSSKTILDYMNFFHKNKYTSNVNIEHSFDVPGVYMIESYIKDSSKGIEPNFLGDLPDGSWIASYKVDNENVWQSIMSGEIKGFSVELNGMPVDISEENEIETIINNINDLENE